MIEIILDASQLKVVEACPYKWYLDIILNLTTNRTNPALSTGSFYHEILKFYYSEALRRKAVPSNGLRDTLELAQYLAMGNNDSPYLERLGVKVIDSPAVRAAPKFHIDRLKTYLINNMAEDDVSEIIAVEQGFSTLLYEDTERRYILEGMIDLITIEPKTKLTVTDHKTQSRFYDKYGYNHQALNYLSFTKAEYFRYNYIGLQDKQGKNTFRRPIFKPRPGMLEQWKRDVKRTFDELARYVIEYGTLSDSLYPQPGIAFPRRRSACDTKFGVCQFHKICEEPDGSKWIPTILTAYHEKENKWRAWS